MYTGIPTMEAYLPMMKSAAMVSAGELGLFHHLATGPSTAAQAAEACGASVHGMRALLESLAAFDLLRCEGGRYSNSPFVQAHFTPAAEVDFTSGLVWTAQAFRITANLTEAVRRGGPVTSLWDEMARRPELGAAFARYMETVAKLLSPMILDAIDVPAHARRMLDVGGSHGLHTAALCARHPKLEAEIVDFAESLTTTMSLLEQRGLSGRVTLRAADATRASFDDKYDVILLLSVLHNQTLAHGEQLVHRLARALLPNGVFVVHEHFRGPIPQLFSSAFDLTLLVETGTATVTEASVEGWLVAAGLTVTKRVELPGNGMGTLLLAQRPT